MSFPYRRTLHGDKTFVFMPSFSKNKQKKKREIWVKGEPVLMEITLQNPLPSNVVVDQVEVLHGDSEVTCIGAQQIEIPAKSTITTRLYLIPGSVGELTLSGVRVCSVVC